MREIPITDMENVRIGQVDDVPGGTGCTVFLFDGGAPAGLSVAGGGPASRESELLKPTAAAQAIHAVVLSGGSAFGLDTAGGVMQYLEERGIGFDVGVTRVPLVCQSALFDLTVADCFARPDREMGYAACVASEHGGNYRDGNHGVGTGCTVGKHRMMPCCMKSGIGSYAVQIGELKVGAVVAVNALGDVYDHKTGQMVAGMRTQDGRHLDNTCRALYENYEVVENRFVHNTSLGVVLTNGRFQKTQLCKIAAMTHDGYARAIRPLHTTADGDSIYAVSVGEVSADQDMVGTLAADVMAEAILRAVQNAESAYGYPALRDMP
ncbi:MAG: P1 family peptidase [Clostridiales bacterium]|nr:P1 family peptidase [Candidatus Cacconaster stercorequi]